MGKSSGKPSGELHGQAVVQSFVEGESDQNQFYFNFEETQIVHFQMMFFVVCIIDYFSSFLAKNSFDKNQFFAFRKKNKYFFLHFRITNYLLQLFGNLQIFWCISPQNVDCVDAFGGQETLVEFSAGRKLQKICFCLNQHWSKDLFYERYNKFCSTKYTLFY